MISILLFVDDRLFISQNKSLVVLNANLFCSYNVISSLFGKFGLTIEYEKMEVFYFSRSQGMFTSPPLDLTLLGGCILYPKNTWQYLGFIFDQKLLRYHSYPEMMSLQVLHITCNIVWLSTLILQQSFACIPP